MGKCQSSLSYYTGITRANAGCKVVLREAHGNPTCLNVEFYNGLSTLKFNEDHDYTHVLGFF